MANYPDITVGDPVTADLLVSMLPQYVYKSSDTSRQSTTTVAADPDLIYNMPAARYYQLQALIVFQSPTTADFKGGLYGPTNATFSGIYHAQDAQTTNTSVGAIYTNAIGFTSTGTFGGSGGNLTILIEGMLYSGDGGNLGFTWAQVASVATATIVRTGSYFKLTPAAIA